jgi:hypothetical protein
MAGDIAMTYPLGWSVISQMLIRRERWPGGYKTRGVALVSPGQEVQPDHQVIRLEKQNLAEAVTAFPPIVLPVSPYADRSAGYDAAQSTFRAKNLHVNGIVLAGMSGRVIDITRRGGVIIETWAAVVQGMIGAGNQVAGILTIWNASSRFQYSSTTPSNLPAEAGASSPILSGTILVIPGPLNFAMLRQAVNSGVVGIVASSISSRDLEDFLRTDLIALINSIDLELAYARLPPITLLFTEGLGTVAMPARTINLLSQHQGSMALISGATSIRQSIYPELIISLSLKDLQQHWQLVQPDPALVIGSQVRICSGSYEGAIGEINHLFIYQQTFASGVRGRAARVRFEDGSMLVIPLNLLERIG